MATRGVFGAIIKMAYGVPGTPAILLLKRKGNDDGSGYPNQWELPGGRVKAGENDITCLARAVFEETGIWVESLGQISPDLSVAPGVVTAQSDDSCVHLCQPREGDLRQFPTNKHKEAQWVTVHELFSGQIKVGCPNPTSKGYLSRMMKMIIAGFNAHQLRQAP